MVFTWVNNKVLVFIFLLVGHVATCQEIIDSAIVHLETVIYFENDEYILSEDDKPEILKLLDSAEKYSNYKFWVDAHTDDVGSEAYNLILSGKRKKSVVEFLKSQNVPDDYIQSNFHGESMRVSFNENDESRRLNRRVVLQLITKKQFLYLKGNVLDEESREGIEAQIQLSAKDFKSKTKSDSTGKFQILSPLDSKVSIEIVAKDHFVETNKLEISDKHRDINLKIPLPKIDIGKAFKFKDMLFVGDKSIILPNSHQALELLKRFMSLNYEQCIEIAGHVNLPNEGKVDKDTRYYQLSVARALEVHDALINIGIREDRILARGYGNWEMIYPFATSENQMRMNRRVEIIISDCDSSRMIQNHEIPNREEFNQPDLSPNQSDILDRYFSRLSFKKDIQNFPKMVQVNIVRQIKGLKENNIDPSDYTYRELLLAFPDLPPIK